MIMLTKAIEYATTKHEGQVRKYTGEPYIEHPLAVAKMIDEYLRAMDVDPQYQYYTTLLKTPMLP